MTLDQIINNLCLLQGFTASAGKPETSKLVGAAITALTRTRALLDTIVDNHEDEVPSVANEASNILTEDHYR
jgi:hypothetical protein